MDEKKRDPQQYRVDLHRRLDTVYEAVSRTDVLASILDRKWYETIWGEIDKADLSGPFHSESAVMLFELDHFLRGVQWFEQAQTAWLNGRAEDLGDDQARVLGIAGLDPLKTFLPVFEERLACFSRIPFRRPDVATKLKELRDNRFRHKFRNCAFELSVLGFLAKQGVLTDIEVEMDHETGTSVDGQINIDGRPILAEATLATKDLLSCEPGIHYGNWQDEVDQVLVKTRKKVADGRQLALARGIPCILFLALNPLAADTTIAKLVIHDCFENKEFAKLSGVVLSDSWKLFRAEFHDGPKAEVPLSVKETETLLRWFSR